MVKHGQREHEADASVISELSYWETGGGYLVFRVWREKDPRFNSEFVVDRRLVGVAEVKDRTAVRAVLKIHGYNPDLIDDLPEYEAK